MCLGRGAALFVPRCNPGPSQAPEMVLEATTGPLRKGTCSGGICDDIKTAAETGVRRQEPALQPPLPADVQRTSRTRSF